jgi:hypothetical protein
MISLGSLKALLNSSVCSHDRRDVRVTRQQRSGSKDKPHTGHGYTTKTAGLSPNHAFAANRPRGHLKARQTRPHLLLKNWTGYHLRGEKGLKLLCWLGGGLGLWLFAWLVKSDRLDRSESFTRLFNCVDLCYKTSSWMKTWEGYGSHFFWGITIAAKKRHNLCADLSSNDSCVI